MPHGLLILLAVLSLTVLGGCSTVEVHATDDSTGSSIGGATVAWTDIKGHTGQQKTDFAGDTVLFLAMPIQTLRVTKEGYRAFETDVFKTDDMGEIKVDARLVPEGEEPSGFGK